MANFTGHNFPAGTAPAAALPAAGAIVIVPYASLVPHVGLAMGNAQAEGIRLTTLTAGRPAGYGCWF